MWLELRRAQECECREMDQGRRVLLSKDEERCRFLGRSLVRGRAKQKKRQRISAVFLCMYTLSVSFEKNAVSVYEHASGNAQKRKARGGEAWLLFLFGL